MKVKTKHVESNNSGEFDEFEMVYPSWVKALIYFGVIFFLGLGCSLIFLGIRVVSQNGIVGILILPIGVWMLYLTFIGYELFKYFSHTVNVHKEGICIHSKLDELEYKWDQICFKASDAYEILEIYDHSKKKILAIDYYVPGTKILLKLLENHTEPCVKPNLLRRSG